MKKYIKNHSDGTIWVKGDAMTKGVPNGYFEWFRKDGTIMRSGYFSKGKQVGNWTTYNSKGKVVKITSFGNK